MSRRNRFIRNADAILRRTPSNRNRLHEPDFFTRPCAYQNGQLDRFCSGTGELPGVVFDIMVWRVMHCQNPSLPKNRTHAVARWLFYLCCSLYHNSTALTAFSRAASGASASNAILVPHITFNSVQAALRANTSLFCSISIITGIALSS